MGLRTMSISKNNQALFGIIRDVRGADGDGPASEAQGALPVMSSLYMACTISCGFWTQSMMPSRVRVRRSSSLKL